MSKSGGIDAGASCQDPTDIRNRLQKEKRNTMCDFKHAVFLFVF